MTEVTILRLLFTIASLIMAPLQGLPPTTDVKSVVTDAHTKQTGVVTHGKLTELTES